MTVKLKPCPFCGGEADYRTMGNCVYIVCTKCGCNTQTFHYKERQEAIKAWNNRPSPWHTGIPTENGDYLVQYESNYTERIFFMNGSFIAKNDMTHGDGSDKYENVTGIVVAWQKIELYKEKIE